MTKSICALVHRPGSDRAAFQAYYEANHAPLGARHFPFTRYVRNHLVDAPDAGFDTISEFWADDIAATAGLMEGSIGDILRADERKFMDQSAIAPAAAEEHVLSAGPPAAEDGTRVATLLVMPEGDDVAFRAAALAWGAEVAASMPGVSLDFATSWQVPPFPAPAVLWSPQPPRGVPAVLAEGVRQLRVRHVETPPATLLGNPSRQGRDRP